MRDALLENLHREQLNPLEEGAAYAQLLDEFGVTHDELARRIGRSRSQVSNTIRLLNLPPSVQRKVAAGVLSAGHARALLVARRRRRSGGVSRSGSSPKDCRCGPSRSWSQLATTQPPGAGDRAPRIGGRPVSTNSPPGLSDHFETRVRVDLGKTRGKITIEFASVDDLDRIVSAMAPTAATPPAREGAS